VFDHEGLLRASARSRPRKTPLPSLGQGSRGKVVRLLEQRLRSLGYWLTGVNRAFDHRTGDAVLAFHKVQGMPRVKSVRPATWRRLASPRRPRPRSTKPAFHVEIDQTKQVLYVIRRGEISEIVHTSTGAGGATRDGVFRVHRKIAGYSPGRLYYPSYFDGLRAVHGWPSVPTYPASHGCSRVPNWTAIHLHNVMPIGTVVRVYH
ncbi:MAG TPA: L,D-transpeptidase family protein, partial [Actinomycetota bacterium]